MNIKLKDGSVREFATGLAVKDILFEISPSLGRAAVAAMLDNEVVDLRTIVEKDAELTALTTDDEGGMKAYRHTASHIMAQAVKRLYPEAKLAIGPAIDNGFYYDFDVEKPFSPEDLEKIEKEMKEIVKANYPIERFELPRGKAIELMDKKGENYKVELINELPEDSIISFYSQDDFTDLCAGPHLMSTGAKKFQFKLLSAAGAYWRGSEKNKMLQRIYAACFEKKEDLDKHLEQLEEAKKRDHNKLGRELGYFTTNEAVGQGLPLICPKGAKTIQIMQRFVEDEEELRGYEPTKTPYMAKSDLYKISGHWDHYKDGMFVLGDEEKDDEVLALRPMTCPFQFMIYKASHHSYRDLPVRYTETSPLFRNEASGEMHGLIRVRQFTLADAHIICRPDQIDEEFKAVLDLIQYIMKALGVDKDVTYRFSKWSKDNREKYIDNEQAWESTQVIMKRILDEIGLDYAEADDEAAFYGPKLDVQFKNVFGKEDTLFTLQVDFALAERFDMYYVDKDDVRQRPYILHRSSIGCYERTLAMLIEKYAGAMPLWISAEQIRILAVTNRSDDYIKQISETMRKNGLRVKYDLRNESIGYKIREARLEKVPYVLVVGDKEQESQTVAVRRRGQGEIGTMSVDEFIAMSVNENAEKVIF